MKKNMEELQKNAFVIFSVVFIFSLSAVTTYNTYQLLLLQNEVQELRYTLYTTNTAKLPPEYLKYSVGNTEEAPNIVKRSIVGATDDGVVVNSESYIQHKRHNFTGRSSGLKGFSEPSVYPTRISQYGSYSSENTEAPNTKGEGTKTPINVRSSRVMHFEDKSKAFRQVVKKSSLKSMDTSAYASNEYSTGSSESEFPVVRDEGVVVRRRNRQRLEILDERHPRTGRVKPLPTIQFGGDTSSYVLGTHENFNGNGHLRHLQRTFVDWKANDWVEKTGMNAHFEYHNGLLTIRESGIYFIYAQIYYLDEHDRNGYRVYKNQETILQCTIFSHSSSRMQKGNTCYTAGVEYVAEGDKISLGDLSDGRYSLFEPGKSFFGVIKLGDIKIRL